MLYTNLAQPTLEKAMLRLPAVVKKTGLPKSSIYQRIKDGSFPRQVHLGPRTVGWFSTDIDQWLNQCAGNTSVAA